MTEWREDNFLEKLANTSAKHAAAGLCSEAEILWASAEPDGAGPISAKLTQHLETCPVCSDLRHRIVLFDQAESLGLDSDAMEAERRLDSWMKGFLASQSLNAQVASVAVTPKVVPYQSVPKTRPFWQIQWALAAAAIVIITVGVAYIRRSIVALTPTTEVARARPDQAPPVPIPSDARSSPEPISTDQAAPQTPAPKRPRAPKAPKVVSEAKTDAPAPPLPESALAQERPPQTYAQITRPVAPDTPVVAENNPASTGSTTVHPTHSPAPVALSQGPSHAISEAKAPGGCATCSASLHTVPRSITPPPIHIPAGTRIWISFQSTTAQIEGQFQFEGTLLLPVTASNAVILERGTSVVGFGATSGTQTSLTITGIVFHGSRYKLRISPGASALQPVASSKVVQFQSGKVAEMWLDSNSTFEAASDSNVGPPK